MAAAAAAAAAVVERAALSRNRKAQPTRMYQASWLQPHAVTSCRLLGCGEAAGRHVRTEWSQPFKFCSSLVFKLQSAFIRSPHGAPGPRSTAMGKPARVLLASLAALAALIPSDVHAGPLAVPCETLTGLDYCTECAKPAGAAAAAKPQCHLCHPTRASIWSKDGTVSEVRLNIEPARSLVHTGCQGRSPAPGSWQRCACRRPVVPPSTPRLTMLGGLEPAPVAAPDCDGTATQSGVDGRL